MLPLDAERLPSVAVIGPHAAEVLLGGYSGEPDVAVSILEGVQNAVGSRGTVRYAEGVRLTEDSTFTDEPQPFMSGTRSSQRWQGAQTVLASPESNEARIREAVALARESEVAIVVVGSNEATSREAWSLTEHFGDRPSLDLPGEQEALVKAVLETGTPTVVLLIGGRPLSVPYLDEHVPAILQGWYLGQETGTAVADVLFGKVNPGGKLPVTMPRSAGQLPAFYNHKPSARRGYVLDETGPLYPFGYGLSYTTLAFDDLRLNTPRIRADEGVDVSVDVTNTGDRAGDEVVQIYVRDEVSSVTRPIKELKAFRKVTLAPGERRTVTFRLGPEAFAFYGINMERVVEPGRFMLMAGPNSRDLIEIGLEILPAGD